MQPTEPIRGPSPKLDKQVEKDLIAKNQRPRTENAYLKNLQALVLDEERRQYIDYYNNHRSKAKLKGLPPAGKITACQLE